MAETETVSSARERMAARLKGHRFRPHGPEDYAPREGAFALRRYLGDYHVIHVEVVFGREGARTFFRLNLGFGPADMTYDELPFLGDEDGKGIRMPFFRALVLGKLERFRQRVYNFFLEPPSWNRAAADTFYYEGDEDLPANIDSAATLISRVVPRFIDHLRRTDCVIPRLKSPYRS